VNYGSQAVIEICRQILRIRLRRRMATKDSVDRRIALFGTRHGLDDIAGIRGMQVAEETDASPVRFSVGNDLHILRFR